MRRADFLVEIQTEELPPKSLLTLASAFYAEITARLTQLGLQFANAEFFATPRRFAVRVNRLQACQANTQQQRRGPALKAAFDENNQPTPACMGFARSCGVTPAGLIILRQPEGAWVAYDEHVIGKPVSALLPEVVRAALAALPIAKRMRWGARDDAFVRPVQHVIMLYGRDIIPVEFYGCQAGRMTCGHRFLSKKYVSITSPAQYEKTLAKNHVIADFVQRREHIQRAVQQAAHAINGKAVMTDALLDEVTGLVEWPVVHVGHFDAAFLAVPKEILISAMEDHQRYFPVTDFTGKLLPLFIMVSNIEAPEVVAGNERVLRARLSDAAFFYKSDQKIPLTARREKLAHITFQHKLGSLADKAERIALLAGFIAAKIGADRHTAVRAAELAKADLTTEVVGEFPELQGIMGRYYAELQDEPSAVAVAIGEHYLPRFSGDSLPDTLTGCAVALADRLDTLVGIFGIHAAPTGDKDPFALRRAALGILRIMIEKALPLDVVEVVDAALQQYKIALPNKQTAHEVQAFIFDRLKPWYQERGVSAEIYAAVRALPITQPYDLHRRIEAVRAFAGMAEASSLSVANKRVSNILTKVIFPDNNNEIDVNLLALTAEKDLATALAMRRKKVASLSAAGDYAAALTELASLREPVDEFFDKVMVMTDDPQLRDNRLKLLHALRALFLHVADIALL